MKRILLIQPPFFRFIGIHTRYFPYHLVCMGTYLKNNGHIVKVLEGDLSDDYGNLDFSDQEMLYDNYLENLESLSDPFWKTLEVVINNFAPDYLGITVWTTFIASAIRTAEYCKEICHQATTIAGGPHVTLMPEDIKKIKAFDIGVIGEGEQTILDIVNGKPLNSIPGIFYSENGVFKQNKPRPFTENLDDFGVPDRSILINEERYENEDMGLIMSSRGCPFKCAYCATTIWRNKVRARSIANLIEEIKLVKSRYGTIYFTFKDDSFAVNKKRVYDFCRRLKKENINICWECNANLNTLDRNMLIEMKSAGCIAIKIGIESGSDRIHKIINKNLTNSKVIEKMKMFKGIGMHLTCYFMMGIPGETRDDILKTLEFAFFLRPDFISFSVYEIFPGTALYILGIKNNTAIDHMEIEDYFKIHPHNYFYSNNKRHLAGMSYEDFDLLEKHMKRMIHKYNRSPKSIYLRIKSRVPLYKRDLAYLFNDMKKFFHWF